MQQTIPVADLQDFLSDSPERRSNFVTTIGDALKEIGFFALMNSGVDRALIRSAYEAAEQFFQLPESVKTSYEIPALNGQRGFTRFGKEHAKNYAAPDLKEFWHVGRDANLPNLNPVEVPQFYSMTNQLYSQLEACAVQLLKACALYLNQPETFLSDRAINGDTILRIIHYPPIPLDAHPSSLRSAPHEDINLITLLCEATDSGLELLQHDGQWRSIPAIPGQIIVDSGDMLQHLTNGLLKSTTHRVVNPDNERSRRFSMPFFVHPNSATDLTPLAQCVAKTGGTIKFPPITAGEYLQQRLKEIGLV